ncbi:Uma2 family endonuclease [Spirosoma sp. KNUC1025]|uniref:Uma2 family endonuclease n=1 Tax=Spirosoma sp. KNUC1025 TaxID=2894082 RepID=UPI00386EF966|nr:Uma2 family endonuclease [Spirosoma sp. KNUC1025]
MPTPTTTKATPKRKRKIPDYLVYEVMDGKPIYYRGYQSVLNKTKTLEDVMGCSSLQAELITYLLRIIFRVFDEKKYRILTNEIGSHIDTGNNLSNDIAIFDKAVLTADKINKKYPDVPPKIAIEIDTEADVSELTGFGYVYKKSKKLLDFGVERIIWIMIGTKTVTVMEPGRDWQVREWDTDIELMDGQTFNIAKYLDEEGIVVEE